MNLTDLHPADKALSAKPLFANAGGSTVAIQLQKGGKLPEHISQVPALLLCVSGEVIYQTNDAPEQRLQSGDYVHIPPQVKHQLIALEAAALVLIK